jgi:Contractile injection system tube protein/LysM domain
MPATSNNKAFLTTEDNQQIPCLFNPSDLALNQANGWAADIMPGKGVPTLRYTGAASGKLRLTLFFDTTDTGEAVTTYTSKIVGLMEVNANLPGSSPATNNARPPWVTFNWGDFHSFKAVVSALELTFEYFSSTGTPLRARANLTLTQYQEDMAFGPQNPTSGTPKPHRTHRVQPGETLDRIAAMHLGDSTKWRMVAEANGIEDPLALRPGSLLAIPGLF